MAPDSSRPGSRTGNLHRLLAPRSIAVVGGDAAEVVVRQCQAIGFPGEVWPVHPTRVAMAGVRCWTDLAGLPSVPDAAFVSVPSSETVRVVAELAELGVGGVVCHASGFAEAGESGRALQAELVTAAGDMALVGPNCLGMVNYLDAVALWCDQHGGRRVERGVAILSQSGNLGVNLTMQQRSLPIAHLVTLGNCAVTGVPELIEALLDDERVTAIGLHLEELPDVGALSRVAQLALQREVPVVALKSGSSELGRQATWSHTRALATREVVCDALFARLGIARVRDLGTFLETLKLLHVHGALPGSRITSASCSGGEAAHLADLAAAYRISLPALPGPVRERLEGLLGERVVVGNPLDYHTYIWGDRAALTTCFSALQQVAADLHLLLLDIPRLDRCDPELWETTLAAFQAAQADTGVRACVVSSLPESMPEAYGRRLVEAGIAPMQGVGECLRAIGAAERIGRAQLAARGAGRAAGVRFTPIGAGPPPATVEQLDEADAKRVLSDLGVPVPAAVVTTAAGAADEAERLGFPVVVKAVSSTLTHKSEAGAVRLELASRSSVQAAVADLTAAGLGDRFLVEEMVTGTVAELLVGVTRDPQVGLTMTLGAGGVLVELLGDTATLLLPTDPAEIRSALESLRVWRLLPGHRGPAADVAAVVGAIDAIGSYACREVHRVVELEVNPLAALPSGVVALDAVVRLARVPGPVPGPVSGLVSGPVSGPVPVLEEVRR